MNTYKIYAGNQLVGRLSTPSYYEPAEVLARATARAYGPEGVVLLPKPSPKHRLSVTPNVIGYAHITCILER